MDLLLAYNRRLAVVGLDSNVPIFDDVADAIGVVEGFRLAMVPMGLGFGIASGSDGEVAALQ